MDLDWHSRGCYSSGGARRGQAEALEFKKPKHQLHSAGIAAVSAAASAGVSPYHGRQPALVPGETGKSRQYPFRIALTMGTGSPLGGLA